MIDDLQWVLTPQTLLLLRYRIIELERYWAASVLSPPTSDAKLKRGKDGAIYRARDLSVTYEERLVHIHERITSEDPLQRTEMLRNCQREADLLFSLQHLAVPTLLDFFTPADRAYLITNYIKGSELQVLVNSNTFSNVRTQEIIQWVLKLCDVIAYLHEQDPPLLFRALDGEKIRIDEDGNLYLTDLSSVSIFHETLRGTQTGVHGFAAPEQYHGEHLPQSDVYSIGAMLHYLLTAHKPPQSGDNRRSTHIASDSELELAAALEKIAYKASAYNPDMRYKTVRDMQKALSELTD